MALALSVAMFGSALAVCDPNGQCPAAQPPIEQTPGPGPAPVPQGDQPPEDENPPQQGLVPPVYLTLPPPPVAGPPPISDCEYLIAAYNAFRIQAAQVLAECGDQIPPRQLPAGVQLPRAGS